MMPLIKRFWQNESGATSIEYAVIAAGIALVIITMVGGIGRQLNTKFVSVNTSLK